MCFSTNWTSTRSQECAINSPAFEQHWQGPLAVTRNKFEKICFISNGSDQSKAALQELVVLYGNCEFEEADIIVALGGDG